MPTKYYGFDKDELVKAHLIVEEFRFRRELAALDPASVEVVEAALTKSQAAKALRVSQRTIEREITAGNLVATGIGKSVRIERDELERYKRLRNKK